MYPPWRRVTEPDGFDLPPVDEPPHRRFAAMQERSSRSPGGVGKTHQRRVDRRRRPRHGAEGRRPHQRQHYCPLRPSRRMRQARRCRQTPHPLNLPLPGRILNPNKNYLTIQLVYLALLTLQLP
jgi:hypothetical protein